MSLLQVSFSPSNTPRLYSKRSSRRQRGSVLEVFHACSQRLLVVTSQWWRGDQFLGENCSSSSFPQLKLLFSLPSAQRCNIPFCLAMPSNYFNENNMYIYMTKNPNKASFSCSFIPRVSTTTASSAYLSFTLSVLSRKSKQKVKLFANTVLHWFTSYTSSQHFWNLVCQSKYMILHEGSLNMKSWIQQAPPQTSPLYIE